MAYGLIKLAIRLRPNFHPYLSMAGAAALRLGKKKESLVYFKMAVIESVKIRDPKTVEKYNGYIEGIASILPDTPPILKARVQWESIHSKAVDLFAKGRPKEALPHAIRAFELANKNFGMHHPNTLNAMNTLGMVIAKDGRKDLAIIFLEKALLRRRKVLGEYHPASMNSLSNLAGVYGDQGQFPRAREFYEDSLRRKRAALGPDHADTLKNMNNLAELFRAKGLFKEAKPLLEEATRRRRAVSGANHPDTLISIGNLAELYLSLGLTEKALTLQKEALKRGQATLGENHPQTLESMNNLAGLYLSLGLYAKARLLYEESLRRFREVLGENHPTTLISMNNLAELYGTQGQYAKARPLHEETLRKRRTLLGENHPDTLSSMSNLGVLYKFQGQIDKAGRLLEEVLKRMRRVLGESHPSTMVSLNNLAAVYQDQGHYQKSLELYEEALRKSRAVYGEKHPKTTTVMANLATVHGDLKQYGKARLLSEKVLLRRRKVLGGNHPNTLISMNNLAMLYQAQGLNKKSLSLFAETYGKSRRILGEYHPNTLVSINNLAVVHQSMGAWQKAAPLWHQYLRNKNRFLNQVLWAADERTRQSYLSQEKAINDTLLSFYRAHDTPASAREALFYSLTRKGLLLKVSSEVKALVRASADPALKESATELSALRREAAQRTLAGPGRMKPEAFQARMRLLAGRIGRLEAELGRSVQQLARGREAVTPEQVVKTLGGDDGGKGAVLVDFLAYREVDLKRNRAKGNQLMAVVVAPSRDPPIALMHLGDLDSIARDIKALRALLSEPAPTLPPELSALAKKLYDRLWKPLSPYIKKNRAVYLVPDGPLHLLPFPALMDARGRFLAETHDLIVLNSSRDLVLPPPTGETTAPVIVSAPDYNHPEPPGSGPNASSRGTNSRGVKLADLHFSPLPGTLAEGRLIAGMLRGKGRTLLALNGAGASEQAVAGLRRPEILHLATHGFFLDDLPSGGGKAGPRRGVGVIARLDPGAPGRINRPPPVGNPLARSGLALAGANLGARGEKQADGTDGILTAMEVLSMDLAGTRLVVLSACETGLGDIRQGEGVYGLRRAFQEAGAAAVLSTLWQVDDAGTQAFMTRFYSRFLQGGDSRSAQGSARAVQREFIASARWRHPFYWAPFVMVGR